MGDIDLLVRPEGKRGAGELLQNLGFATSSTAAEDHEWVYTRGIWEIELHHRLLYDDELNSKKLSSFTDNAWRRCRVFRMKEEGYRIKGTGETSTEPKDLKNPGVDVQHHLEPEFHFVYLLLHLQKHFLWGGIRLRQFLDLAMMMKNCPMDWNRIEADLTELGQMNFAKVCFALIERWFGVTSPVGCAEISEEFYGSTTETILGDCIFVDPENANKVDMTVMNEVQKERAGFLKRLKMMLNVLFPPYEQLRAKYPEMAVSPLLLPLLWLRRFMEAVLHKQASERLSFAAKPLTMNKELKEREALLKQWGL